jgi:molybdate transport system substrate-binding protein
VPIAGKILRTVALAICLLATIAPGAMGEEVLVFAASSTTDALTEIGRDFDRETGNHTIFSFAASSTLARQIIAGAPADIFLSADTAKMDDVRKTRLVSPDTVINLLSNQLVIVVASKSKIQISAPSGLKSLHTIATGDPAAVPVGVYARKWLESQGVWDAVAPYIVPTLDVRAALTAAETGAADAAIVYKTDAATSRGVKIVYEVAREAGPQIIYPVAKLTTSKKTAAAQFIEFLRSDKARAVFIRSGFIVL